MNCITSYRKYFAGFGFVIGLVVWLLCGMAAADAQVRSLNYGLSTPQDPATLPKSLVAVPKVIPKAKVAPILYLKRIGNDEYAISGGWEMIAEQKVKEDGSDISRPTFNTASWFNATVPGTVLTTLVDQGIYADPYWGINNLSIPDTLCRQNWWYRTAFNIIPANKNKECWLTFNGINYEANIWLNGHLLGNIKGAFKRGVFNGTHFLNRSGKNILAVQIIPPPHPGIPHEQSVLAGRGPNGGVLCLDGPTFISSEGWDWIPGIRDRNIGIWQDVVIRFTDHTTIIDPQVITDLDLPDTTRARITIKTSVYNSGIKPQTYLLRASFEGVSINQQVTVGAGETKPVTFNPGDYPALNLKHPRLWWPNGYGKPELYHLELTLGTAGKLSDSKSVRFGIRELSYELTVDAPSKMDWRVEFNPTDVFRKTDKPLFDNNYRRKVTGETVVPALYPGIDAALLKDATDNAAAPYLVIKVNGKRVFCRGGNCGMDDGMKRSDRERLEPYLNYPKRQILI